MKNSALVSTSSLMAAFLKAEGIEGIGGNPQFLTFNQTQLDYFNFYKIRKNDVALLPEIKSIATKNYDKLKGFLDKNKFDSSSLRRFSSDTIGIAALLEIISPWECNPGIVSLENGKYKAICFNSDCIDIRRSGKHLPIFVITLRNGDQVIVTAEPFPKSVTDLNQQFMDLYEQSTPEHHSTYKGLILPYVSIDYHCNMSWLLGSQIVGKDPRPFTVTQAIQQNILTLNHEGVMARSASTISLTRSYVFDTTGYYEMNRPFLFALVRPGTKTPLFTGYFMSDSWVKR